jgi:hypothetical protein
VATPARIMGMTEPSRAAARQVRPGNMVRTGDNLYPHYRVIAISDDKAWIRDVQYGTDHVVELERIRRVGPLLVEDGGRAHSRARSR